MQKNVKRIYFEDDLPFPIFELEDGTIKEPFNNGYGHIVFWAKDDAEANRYKTNYKKREGENNKPKDNFPGEPRP